MKILLNLSLDKSVIENAKEYAKLNNQSLSEIVESYLNMLTSQASESGDSDLDSIRGIISVPKEFDFKTEVRNSRIKKYT